MMITPLHILNYEALAMVGLKEYYDSKKVNKFKINF